VLLRVEALLHGMSCEGRQAEGAQRAASPGPAKMDLRPKHYAKLRAAGTTCVTDLGSGDSSLLLDILPHCARARRRCDALWSTC
jgi:hypothetical protein